MRRWIGLLGLCLWLSAWGQVRFHAPVAYDERQGAYYVANEWIVGLDTSNPRVVFSRALMRLFGYLYNLSSSLEGAAVLRLDAGLNPEDVGEILRALPGVRYVERNYLAFTCNSPMPNDPLFGQQWNLLKIGALQAWALWQPQRTVYIAIIDTGVDTNHPDLTQKLRRHNNGAIYGYNAILNNPFVSDGNGHGTHCAGIAAAHIGNGVGVAGVAAWNPNVADAHRYVQVMPVKVLNDHGVGTFADVARGITWAVDNGADVLSLSLGASVGAQVLADAVNYAWNRGRIVVAAAGNEGNTQPFYPAFYENAIAVAATDPNDQLTDFSQHGAWVDIAAPGFAIRSTIPGGYAVYSGTSMAAPHVAGAAALIWSAAPSLDNQQLRAILESQTDPYQPLWGGIGAGKGRLNVHRALAAALQFENTPQLAQFSLSASVVQAGNPVQATVSLTRPAGAGGVVVQLQSSNPQLAACPPTITIPQGQMQASFTVQTAASGAGSVQITATLGATSRTASLTLISPYRIQALRISPVAVAGGQSATLVVELNRPAPAGGLPIQLSSNTALATVPSSVVVPAGQARVSVSVNTVPVASPVRALLSATLNSTRGTATLIINPPAPASLEIAPPSVAGGQSAVATVTLNASAPAQGLWLRVSHNRPQRVYAPNSVFVPAGARTVQFRIDTVRGRGVVTAVITVRSPGGQRTATLTVR